MCIGSICRKDPPGRPILPNFLADEEPPKLYSSVHSLGSPVCWVRNFRSAFGSEKTGFLSLLGRVSLLGRLSLQQTIRGLQSLGRNAHFIEAGEDGWLVANGGPANLGISKGSPWRTS